jgi:Activator of Hsp90 ATPase homolog 1-like protein
VLNPEKLHHLAVALEPGPSGSWAGRFALHHRFACSSPHGSVWMSASARPSSAALRGRSSGALARQASTSASTLLFADKDGGTELTLIHERFANAEDLGGHEHGWIGSLEKLAAVVGG